MTAISTTFPARSGQVASTITVERSTTQVSEVPNYFAIYSSAVFVMTLLFLFGVGVPAALAYGNAAGWGLGAFCAFWGGPGFGVMAGGARVAAWQDKHAAH